MKTIFALIMCCAVLFSCTDLNAPVYDGMLEFWQTPQQVEQGVAHAYVLLRGYAPTYFFDFPNTYNLNEMSTDEVIVPVRGPDWNDQIMWEELWKHTWTPDSYSVRDGWQFIFDGVSGTNQIIESLHKLKDKPENFDELIAEMRVLRAFYYYQALDLFGNVPIVEKSMLKPEEVATRPRQDVFAYVESEIKAVLPDLSPEVAKKTYGRATQWFAQVLLAKLYLNAEIFTGNKRLDDCSKACDAIINSGRYALESNFFKNFAIANEDSKENIFVIPFDGGSAMGEFVLQGLTLHYNSGPTFGLPFGGVNGFSSTAEYLNIFDDSDIRKKMFLVGQQYANQIPDDDHLLYDRQGNLLIFDPVITSFHVQPPKMETAGARCAKWEFGYTWNMSNDFAVYRLADVILMKAEAQLRNGDKAGALSTINSKHGGVSIRSRTGLPDFPESEMTLDGLLAERARELSWEGHRRNDLIRFGHFTDARIPEKGVSDPYRTLFPVPRTEINKNPHSLEQNPGY